MKTTIPIVGTLTLLFLQSLEFSARAGIAPAPENIAPKAAVSASAKYSADYAASFAVDGRIAEPECMADQRQAWCAPMKAGSAPLEFTLEWPQPVKVAEVVYYGRTGAVLQECFKDYEIRLDDDALPAAKGAFEMVHGPQRVPVAPREVRRIRMTFLSCFGGPNPGAAEIAVYGSRPTDGQLAGMVHSPLSDRLVAGELGFRDMLVIKRHHLSTSHVYTYHAEGFVPGGGLYVFSPATRKLRELVNAGEGEIIDCDLSYDGREVVFSWKQRGKPHGSIAHLPTQHCTDIPDEDYQIFRINVDGTALTQLTDDKSNNLNPCWLPDGGIAFISDRKTAFAYCFVSTSPILHRMGRDGSDVQRLSSSYLMDFTPAVLDDGRIVYTRWEYVDRPACPIQSLWAIRPDGTGLAGFFGNRVLDPGTFMQTHSIPKTGRVLCLLTAHNGDPRGAIGILDIARGGNAQEAIRNLTPEINIGHVDRATGGALPGNVLVNAGPYETPYPVDDRHYLVSRSGTIQLRDYDGAFPPAAVLPKTKDGMGYYSPVPVKPRTTPPVPARQQPADKQEPWATVFMSDVYKGLEPHVKRGEVKQICVVEEVAKEQFAPLIHDGVPGAHGYAANTAFGYQFPLVSCGATYAPKKVWGFADVAADGSAGFKVPSGLPVYFLALDAQGRAVQRMRTFTHFMPGEKQGCVGCHADRNYAAAPPRAAPPPELAAQELRPPDWGIKGFSYREVVQPVLDRHCVECHNARSAAAGVDLGGDMTDFFNVSYEILARKGTFGEWHAAGHGVAAHHEGRNPYTSWIASINGTEYNILQTTPRTWGSPASKLADLIIAGHPDTNGNPRVKMDFASRQRVMTWIDLNVPYYPNSSSKNLKAMGCRRVFPIELDATLKKVAAARCDSCHARGIPRSYFIRIETPELNSFLLAPLAKSAGGTEKCGKAVFASASDPDYRAILKTFEPVATALRESPREDMPEWKPDAPVRCDKPGSEKPTATIDASGKKNST